MEQSLWLSFEEIDMKILLVVDQFYQANNGTTISAQRFAKALCDRGNQLRVVSCGEGDKEEDYLVQEWKVPILTV